MTSGREELMALVVSALLLASCDGRPDHAEWQGVCVETTTTVVLTMVPNGNGGLRMQPMPQTRCVKTELRCVAGKDGSTQCRALAEQAQ